VPFARFVTVAVVAVTLNTAEDAEGMTSTVYLVMGQPPVIAGAFQVRSTAKLLAAATRFVGAAGRSGVVTAAEAIDAGPVPTAFDAATVKV
jgi:hypothetical protein